MAGFTTVHADCNVFKSEWTSFVGVAFDAGLLVGQRMLHHPLAHTHTGNGRWRAVRIVAIRTLHKPFVDAVFKGHGELGLHAGVTCHA